MTIYDEGHGAIAEREWCRRMRASGFPVLATSEYLKNTPGTAAPMLWTGNGDDRVPVCDALVIGWKGRQQLWTEIKSKMQPGWLRYARRWEHGIDFVSFEDYEEVAVRTGMPVVLVIHECSSPTALTVPEGAAEADFLRPFTVGPDGEPVTVFLAAPLKELRAHGHRERDWPDKGGRRSRRGLGGWLWPRSVMCGVDGPCNCLLRALGKE